jgi:type VI secretion system protein ImpA
MLFTGPDGRAVSLYEYAKSEAAKNITDPKELQLRVASGLIPYDKLQQAARASTADLARLRAGLLDAEARWRDMGTMLDKVAGREAPSTGFISELLGRIGVVIKRYAPASAENPEPLAPAEDGQQVAAAGPAAVQNMANRLVTREDALAKLSEIADYFRRTEPQSPLAYTIDEAIRRGRMTWPELLQEVVSDQQLRNTILSSLGIKLG